MISRSVYGDPLPFPPLAEDFDSDFDVNNLALRSFGTAKPDLEIDFDNIARPHLVTRILQGCTVSENGDIPEESFFWNLTLGKRIECLATVAVRNGQSPLRLQFRCSNEKCGEVMEFEIINEDLRKLQSRADVSGLADLKVGEELIQFRLPTGRDQRDWLAGSYPDEQEAIHEAARSLLISYNSGNPAADFEFSEDAIDNLNEAMSIKDPLTVLKMGVICSSCGFKNQGEFDLEGIILEYLRTAQQRLLKDVHTLAAAYHWSEEQVLSIPPWRRSRYLELIERGRKR